MARSVMSPSAATAPTDAPELPAGHKRLIALLVASTFVVILNETIMSVALPRLMDDLDIPATTAQWLTTAFLLTMAVVIPVTGFLLQRFHVRTVFLGSMIAFSTGTLVAALAPGFVVLLVGRIIQAIGTALMMPLLMTTILNLVPEARRGAMMGTVSIVISVAPAIGPTISGLVLSGLDWRWMFWIVLPISLLSLALGARWVENVTEPRVMRIDAVSVGLSALGFSGIVYGLSSIGEQAQGETLLAPWIPITVGVVGLLGFGMRQLALRERALLDIRCFTNPIFSVATALMAVSMMALFGAIILLPMYLQDVQEVSTLTTGLLLLPGGLVMGLLSPVVGRLYDRVGPRPLVIPAAVVVSASLLIMTTLDEGSSLAVVVLAHVVLSAGLAMMFTPLLTTALGAVPPQLYSHGSAIVSTMQQVAGAAGTAIFITVMTRRATAVSDAGTANPDALSEGIQRALTYGVGLTVLAIAVAVFLRRPPAPQMPPAADSAAVPA
ncbi:MFS transporter [Paraconexibacter algicola]|uniref:MFS transporter n=2 Tax=Paraconexibacter algicola TaxID=2133960 RepID=A0A2T4UCL9_9ACTN|nr:MFS transporter [Paraconexibacter algicola]